MKQAFLTKSFTGVILAGGASRRMGRDKAGLPVSDTVSMLEHMRHILFECGASQTVVLGKPDEADGIADAEPFAGPVKAVIDYLDNQQSGTKHLFVPVDMPCLDAQTLRHLAAHETWTKFDRQAFPFLAVVGREYPVSIKRLQGFLQLMECHCLPVEVDEEDRFLNLNDPQDFRKWKQSC